jgi:ABC-2 type transport system ATP-binding protein
MRTAQDELVASNGDFQGSCISVRGLVKRFGSVVALAGVDLQIRAGEIVALLGPNGAGKSTLLRVLGTAVLPDEGSASVMGHDVRAEPAAVRRSIGLVLGDERSWYWRLTGRHNLEFFAAMHGMRRHAAALRAIDLLDQVDLLDAADRLFAGYSSGMRTRLSLARALIAEPPVLLLDEPTRNLDPVAAHSFREMVTRLAEERGTAVLFATHDLHEAAEIATHVVGLASGRVAFTKDRGADAKELERAVVGSVEE